VCAISSLTSTFTISSPDEFLLYSPFGLGLDRLASLNISSLRSLKCTLDLSSVLSLLPSTARYVARHRRLAYTVVARRLQHVTAIARSRRWSTAIECVRTRGMLSNVWHCARRRRPRHAFNARFLRPSPVRTRSIAVDCRIRRAMAVRAVYGRNEYPT